MQSLWSTEAAMAHYRPYRGTIMLHTIKSMQDHNVLLHPSQYLKRHNIPVPHIEPSPASCLTTAERPEEGTGVHDQQDRNTVREAIISSFQ